MCGNILSDDILLDGVDYWSLGRIARGRAEVSNATVAGREELKSRRRSGYPMSSLISRFGENLHAVE
jgi:hypothetical protein